MKSTWIYMNNTFEVNTRYSMKRALVLFEDSYAKLCAFSANDAGIMDMKNDFEPFYLAFQDIYSQKQFALGVHEGHTKNVEQKLADVPNFIRIVEGKVRAEFPEDSFEEHSIFPNKRTPFMQGSYESRINAFKTLIQALDQFPILAGVKASVESFYNQLVAARLVQQQKEGLSDELSNLLEAQRIKTCEALYGTLGRLMYRFRNNRERIGDFFDLTLLRNLSNGNVTGILKGIVTDVNGAPVAGAVVRFPEAGYESTTNAKGEYTLEAEAGNYLLEVVASNFPLYVEDSVVIEKEKSIEKNIVLKA